MSEFEKKALSHIPKDILASMTKETSVDVTGMSPLEAIYKEKGKLFPKPTDTKMPMAPEKPALMSYAIDGHVITVPTDSVGAAISMFYTLVAFVWSKDKKVAKILKQFDFKFLDSNGSQVYPIVKKRKYK